MSDGFEMTTGTMNMPITGRQKAAILFAELGLKNTKNLMGFFSDDEIKKLRKAMETLGPYNPNDPNFYKIQAREVKVMESACKYGVNNKFLPPEVLERKEYGFVKTGNNVNRQNNILKNIVDNPETITNVLRAWLGEE